MHAAVDIVPPVQFGPQWLLLGLLAVALVVAWYLLVPVIARRSTRRAAAEPAFQRPYLGPATAHQRALAAIDAVERDAVAGSITPREAHLRLSAIVREFAWDMTRVDARTMTLTELRAAGFPTIANAVSQFYPIAFQEHEPTEVGDIANVAREPVVTWR